MGTFALVLAGTGAVVVNDVSGGAITHVGIALAFGLAIVTMAYAVGDVSGGHFNPAVTVGLWLSRRLPGKSVLPYVAAQVAGAFAASGILFGLFGNRAALGATLPAGDPMQAFAFEALATALLVFVVLSVSTAPKSAGLMAGIAIGGMVGLGVMFAGPISGGSMNPARSLAPAVLSGNFASLWVYLAAPLAGAASAVGAWRVTRTAPAASDAADAPLPIRTGTPERKAA